ncbi:ADP-ribosylation factor-related protein 1-like [Acanthaster planci]|uniref:ADP-ribosylation factor-related protein 1 n=1 Tax=Acanthaster planci TaxID=133434 RepID=A0A8B7ZCQ6_ACAPL|nr:ADP-ribosylation factor-related protein 1-like [Acanthaster planci]
MFSLLYGLWQYIFRRDEYFILILGLDNAGKTTFLQTTQMQFNKDYKGMPLDKITTTVGLNIGKIDTARIRLMFWDLGGQEELQALWDKYYAESHAVIYVVDSSDKERLAASRLAFDKMISSEALHGVPLLVLANKQDLPDVLHVSDIKAEFNKSASSIGRRDCHIQPVSALTGEGVNEGIDWLVECVKRNTYQRPPHAQEIS